MVMALDGTGAKRALQQETLMATSVAHDSSNGCSKPLSKKVKVQEERALIPQSLVNALYSRSNVIKLWNVASKALGSSEPPVLFPEYTGEDRVHYVYRTLDFWTSGFFPGSLYLLLERQTRYPSFHALPSLSPDETTLPHRLQLEHLCRWWTVNLHPNAVKRDTHDLGFMIAPWAMKAWGLHRDPEAYSTLVLAAHTLASRFDSRVQSLRSWDRCATKRYTFTDTSKDFLVIIDNMLNLDMLFWVARETNDQSMYDMAVAHARTTQKHHIHADYSTCHVVNYDPCTGEVKAKFTHQGYSDGSCWARGQSWGILGFMQTYEWTGDESFLDTARKLSDYFIQCLPEDGVPYWDFGAPVTGETPRDTSAGMVACCGMLLLYKSLRYSDPISAQFYLDKLLWILQGTMAKFATPSKARFGVEECEAVATYPENLPEEQKQQPGRLVVVQAEKRIPETILDGATINNHEFASRRWADHGLVYADYYFMLLGNMLLEMGLV